MEWSSFSGGTVVSHWEDQSSLLGKVASDLSHEGSAGLHPVMDKGRSGDSTKDEGLVCMWQVAPL